jgi:hypothetical protein
MRAAQQLDAVQNSAGVRTVTFAPARTQSSAAEREAKPAARPFAAVAPRRWEQAVADAEAAIIAKRCNR